MENDVMSTIAQLVEIERLELEIKAREAAIAKGECFDCQRRRAKNAERQRKFQQKRNL